MISIEAFTAGLVNVAVQLGQAAEAERIVVHFRALHDETDEAEWTDFCATAPKRFRWKFIPSVPEFMDALDAYRGTPALDVEAVNAYDRVVDSGTYSPNGTTWSYRTIESRCGKVAAEAFVAAGGNSAFATTYREEQRRAKFVAAYERAARAMPENRLLPAAKVERPRLLMPAYDPPTPEAPTQSSGPLSADESAAVLRGIAREPTPEPAATERPRPEPKRSGYVPLLDVQREERMETLRAQAAQIVREEEERRRAQEAR